MKLFQLIFIVIVSSVFAVGDKLPLSPDVLLPTPLQQEVVKLCPDDCSCKLTVGNVTTIDVICNERNLTDVPKIKLNSEVNKLDIGRNEITELTADALDPYKGIHILLAYMNDVSAIDGNTFNKLKNLEEIDLSDNMLLFINPDTFKNNEKLRSVLLSGNALVEVSGKNPILNAPWLKQLDVSFCKLASLSTESFKNLKGLESLDISSNDFSNIDIEVLTQIEALRTVKIGNNRFTCGCDLTRLLSWISKMQHEFNITEHRPVKCRMPGGERKTWTVASNANGDCATVENAIQNDTTNCARGKRDTKNCCKDCIKSINSEENTTVESTTLASKEEAINSATVLLKFESFFEQNSYFVFFGLLLFVALSLSVLAAYIIVKRISRNNEDSEQHYNRKNDLVRAFGAPDYTKLRDSRYHLLRPSSPDQTSSPTTRQQELFQEYISSRPTSEHLYEEIRPDIITK